MGDITTNFSYSEVACRCGQCEWSTGSQIYLPLIHKLQEIRSLYGKPMPITSGIRCEAHNRAVGGVVLSYHTPGRGCRAVDVGVTDRKGRCFIVGEALYLGLSVGLNSRFIHLDLRDVQTIFTY